MSNYALTLQPRILGHNLVAEAPLPVWFGDFGEPADETGAREYNHLDAIAASGDLFITLATRLDKIAQGLPQDSAEQIEIEHLVKMLFYLQDHWTLGARRGNG